MISRMRASSRSRSSGVNGSGGSKTEKKPFSIAGPIVGFASGKMSCTAYASTCAAVWRSSSRGTVMSCLGCADPGCVPCRASLSPLRDGVEQREHARQDDAEQEGRSERDIDAPAAASEGKVAGEAPELERRREL